MHDDCFCARDDVAEPFSTCGNTGSGCGGCSDETMCSLAPGCSFDSTATPACSCDSGYSVSTLCDGAGNLQTFFFDSSSGDCHGGEHIDLSAAVGVFDTPIDEDDGGRCDHRGRQGSEESGWYEPTMTENDSSGALRSRSSFCMGLSTIE